MSRERARRREVREAVVAAERVKRARAQKRDRRRAVALARVTSVFGRRRRRTETALDRHRGRQNGALLSVLICVHTVFWLVQPSWGWRVSGLVLTAFAWPVLVVVLFDRRSSS